MPKVVFSKTLAGVDWNAELVRGDALEAVARLKRQPGKSMSVGGSALATSLAQGGLIDEFRFYVMPTIVGAGTSIFHTLSKHIDLTPVEVRQFTSGAVSSGIAALSDRCRRLAWVYWRKILSIDLPFASSSISLSRYLILCVMGS